jgi:hypothetical protein
MKSTGDEWFQSILRDPETGQALERRDDAFVRMPGPPSFSYFKAGGVAVD